MEGKGQSKLCDVEEARANRALDSIDNAVETLRDALDDLFRRLERGEDAGTN